MPRLPTIHEPVLRDLAQELRFAPRQALLRHIERAEQLAGVLESDQIYPREWIVFRVTGFRPHDTSGQMPRGRDILSSLSAFVECLCETATLGESEVPRGSLGPEQMCQLWGMSRATLDRARRRGLVARRVVGERGTRTLIFTPQACAAFAQREKPGPRPTAHRMSPTERKAMIRRAGQYHARLGLSLNQVAARLAPRFNFSHEGVRRLLQRECAEIFGQAGPPSAREQEFAFRALRRGIEPGLIAQRLGRPRTAIVRAANQHRARALAQWNLDGPMSAQFEREDADQIFMPRDRSDTVAVPLIPIDLPRFIEACRASVTLERAAEHAQAAGMHFLRWRARRLIGKLAAMSTAQAGKIDEAETMLREISQIKSVLAASQLGLLLATAERRVEGPIQTLPEKKIQCLVDAMFVALCGAIDGFDPFHGGRLAARTGMLMDREAAAYLRAQHPGKAIEGRARRTLIARDTDSIGSRLVDPWQAMLEADPRVAVEAVNGTFDGAQILCRRFGLGGQRPRTLAQIAVQLGTPVMHAARLERSAVRLALSKARSRIR